MGDPISHRGHVERNGTWRGEPAHAVWLGLSVHRFSSSLLLWPIFHCSPSSSGWPQSVSLAGVAEGPTKMPERNRCVFGARRVWRGLGEAGECKALEKLLSSWSS